MKKNPTVAIVGATGAVGVEFAGCMERRNFPAEKIVPLASTRSVGKTMTFRGADVPVQELTEASFAGVDIAMFSAGASISRKFAPLAVKAGAVVVDNSSAFRMDREVPLVVPEINANRIREHKGIVANPNCATITALVPLWPIHKVNRIHRVILSTYQAASGAGAAAMAELIAATKAYLEGKPFQQKVMPHPYAFNLFSHNASIDLDSGYNGEESKVIAETKKIFEDDEIAVGVTCVRVPVLRAHTEAITIECAQPITEADVRKILSVAPGVKIVDEREKNHFPMPIEASEQDDVLVGRIRQDTSDPSGHSIALLVAADQLLKGAALNAIQIAELL